MLEKRIELEDIFKNPDNIELINAYNRQLQKDMAKVYEESDKIEKKWDRQFGKLICACTTKEDIIKIGKTSDQLTKHRNRLAIGVKAKVERRAKGNA